MRNGQPVLWAFILCNLLAGAAHAGGTSGCAGTAAATDDVSTLRLTLGNVPAILRAPHDVTKPPIILWHGFGPPASEAALMKALPLDDVPSVKVYLGLPLFGARAPVGSAKSVARRQAEDYASALFEPSVLGAARELAAVTKALRERKCLHPNDEIGLFGFSAGGAAALFALAERDVRVGAAITINAPAGLNPSIDALERATKKPYAWTPATRQLAEQADPIRRAAQIAEGNPPPALLLIHGADDTMITVQGATSLRDALQPLYEKSGNAERLSLLLEPGVSHDWTEPRKIPRLRTTVADWFNRHLHRDPADSRYQRALVYNEAH